MSVLLERWLAHAGDRRAAIRDSSGLHTYDGVVERSLAIADDLRTRFGVDTLDGARVAIFAPASAAFVEAFFGILLAGGCVVVLSSLHPAAETRYFCEDAGVTVALVARAYGALAAGLPEACVVQWLEAGAGAGARAEARARAGAGAGARAEARARANADAIAIAKANAMANANANAKAMAKADAKAMANAMAMANADARLGACTGALVGRGFAVIAPRIGDDAPALQLYTSGTTGKPKGAVITHGNLATQQGLLGAAWGFGCEDRLLHALPLHHMHGLAIALLTALGAGATTHLTTFEASAIWEAMADASVFMAVPSMYHRLFVAFDAASTETQARWAAGAAKLRLATSGSAALPVTLAERWKALTGKIPLERFGMTEIGVGLTNALDGERHPGCVGFPLPTVETRIVGDDGADADTGELWIRGPSVFAGYHRRDAETAIAFAKDERGGDPWFRTGDTVTRERSREGAPFRILGRTSVDILKSGGYKLSALEIEEVLREHPGVAEVAVIGVPDEAWGDRVVACVVLRPGAASCDEAVLRAFARERLAPYKVPKNVLIYSELPKNPLGKVLKPALLEMVLGEAGRQVCEEVH